MTQQEIIKTIVTSVGVLIDARAKTLETNLHAEISELRQEIKDTKMQLHQEIKNTKIDLQQKIKDSKIELKTDIHALRVEVGTKITDHDKRLYILEEKKLTHRN